MLGEDKVGEVSEHPIVPECPVDDSQKLPSGGNDRLAAALLCSDPLVKLVQITAISRRRGDRALDADQVAVSL